MKKILFILCTISLLFTSCQEWLTIQPDTMMSQDEMFTTKTGFVDALNGAYYYFAQAYSPSGPMMTGEVEFLANMWFVESQTSTEYKLSDHDYEDDAVDSKLKSMFSPMYLALANVNPLIEEIRAEEGILTEAEHKNYLGQALAIRAFLNMDLIRLWGPIPSDPIESKKYLPYPKTATVHYHEYITYAEFCANLEADIDEAIENLSSSSYLQLYIPAARFHLHAVKALKARYYMWIGDTENAYAMAKEVMGVTGKDDRTFYTLADHDNQSSATLPFFQCENIASIACEIYMAPSMSNGKYVYANFLNKDVFEGSSSDLRLSAHWQEYFTTNDDNVEDMGVVMVLTKYATKSTSTDTYTIYVPLIRLSEMYFIAMECAPTMAETNELYKTFAQARGIPAQEFTNLGDFRETMIKEYRKEFWGEGQMFYLYKRYFVQNMLNGLKGCNRDSYELPLPTRETEF